MWPGFGDMRELHWRSVPIQELHWRSVPTHRSSGTFISHLFTLRTERIRRARGERREKTMGRKVGRERDR